jgi:hypothetical protein
LCICTFIHYSCCRMASLVQERGNSCPSRKAALGEQSDESKLKDAIMTIFDCDHFKWEDNPILESLKCDGITKWSTFVRLTYMDVNNLEIKNRGKIEPIPSWWKEC